MQYLLDRWPKRQSGSSGHIEEREDTRREKYTNRDRGVAIIAASGPLLKEQQRKNKVF